MTGQPVCHTISPARSVPPRPSPPASQPSRQPGWCGQAGLRLAKLAEGDKLPVMPVISGSVNEECVGRDAEVSALQYFLDGSHGKNCLVLLGDAGIGKTTLWEAAISLAVRGGRRVLSARASQAETGMPFAALADLAESVEPEVVLALPGPQRHALEVAIRRADPAGEASEPVAISAGFLSVLKAAAEREELLVAIDDVQWLDPSSAAALLFAARRLADRADGRIRFLLCRRPGRPSALEGAFRAAALEELTLGPMSTGAIGRVLSDRLAFVPPRRVLRLACEVSQGNPLFAIELGRSMVDHGIPEHGSEVPLPHLADEVFGDRVRGLAGPLHRVLLATALSAGIGWWELSRLVDPLALDDCVTAGLITVERSRVRPSHPLLGAAARQLSGARERRDLHLALASAVDDPILQAGHWAMATAGPDEALAQIVAAAAVAAAERGAVHEAEHLAAHALRLTPAASADYPGRLLALARCHLSAGELTRVTELLGRRLRELPAGRPRAEAHLMLGEAASVPDEEAHLDLARAEAGDDREFRIRALARKALLLAVGRVQRLPDAEDAAREALEAAGLAAVELRLQALSALAWVRLLRGRPIDDLLSAAPPTPPTVSLNWSLDRLVGIRLAFRGEVQPARIALERVRDLTEQRGDLRGGLPVTVQLCELELRAGEVRRAARFLDDLQQWSGLDEVRLVNARLGAVLAAVSGDPATTARHAAVLLEGTAATDLVWDWLEAARAAGIAAMLERNLDRALGLLRAVWDHTQRAQVDDPGVFPVAADLVEASVLGGDLGAAAEVTDRLRLLAASQDHPWGMVTARRCTAVLALAGQYTDAAAAELADTAAEYGRLGLHYDQGRTQLHLGRLQRRYNKRAAARGSLTQAQANFGTLGCDGWAAEAAAELSRISGRRTGHDDGLTVSELRTAQLAARGLSNKEIAGQLFVSVYTVEAHLSHAYAKLGIRARAQLAARLAAGAGGPASDGGPAPELIVSRFPAYP
jgi:DNA-binding CsgD family transcriptional regulator